MDWLRSRHSLQLELIALRHQVTVYKQSVSRPKIRLADRLLWVWLSRLWPGWQGALEFVQPRTVLAWQKKRFRDYWRRLSQSGKPGCPAISKKVIKLTQDMWRSNPTWGSPQIVESSPPARNDIAGAFTAVLTVSGPMSKAQQGACPDLYKECARLGAEELVGRTLSSIF